MNDKMYKINKLGSIGDVKTLYTMDQLIDWVLNMSTDDVKMYSVSEYDRVNTYGYKLVDYYMLDYINDMVG